MRLVAQSSSKKVCAAFDIGCRLCVGLEQALLDEKKGAKGIIAVSNIRKNDDDSLQERFLHAFSISNNFMENDSDPLLRLIDGRSILISEEPVSALVGKSPTYYSDLFEKSYDVPMEMLSPFRISPHVSDGHGESHSLEVGQDDLGQDELLFAQSRLFEPVLEGTVRSDGVAWLYMTPEELEEEMNHRVQATKDNTQSTPAASREESESNTVEASDKEELEDQEKKKAEKLQEILDGFKTFLRGKSDVDGVKVSPSEARESHSSEKKKTKQATVPTDEQLDNINFDLIQRILDGGGGVLESGGSGSGGKGRVGDGRDRKDGEGSSSESDSDDDDSDSDRDVSLGDSDDEAAAVAVETDVGGEIGPRTSSEMSEESAAACGRGRFVLKGSFSVHESTLPVEDAPSSDSDDEIAGDYSLADYEVTFCLNFFQRCLSTLHVTAVEIDGRRTVRSWLDSFSNI